MLICYTFIINTYEEEGMSDINTYKNQNGHKNYSDSGILQGTINFIGLECPSFNRQEIPPCSGPYPNFIIRVYAHDNEKEIVATTQTDSNGIYQIILKPGKYLIYSSLESSSTIDIGKANVYEYITIRKNETITKNYNIDAKIR
jgi:hypothetical protein